MPENPGLSIPGMVEAIASRASGMSLDRLLATRLFLPLGMRSTYHEGSPPGEPRLFSSASDLSVYAQMLLNRGIYAHRRYFSPETVSRFTGNLRTRGRRFTFGWLKPDASDWTGRLFSPSSFGCADASGSLIWIDPAKELFIVLLVKDPAPGEKESASGIQESVCTSVMEAVTKQ
jgi:CubicO group peptidase (beta-lactamase class C family)